MRFVVTGKTSWFGGPEDTGVKPDEGLALVQPQHVQSLNEYFLPEQPEGTTGLARRLNPKSFYVACRWPYRDIAATTEKAKRKLRETLVPVTANGRVVMCKPLDWGPNAKTTDKDIDLSKGAMDALGIKTGDIATMTLEL